jgi:hypothetical protein
LYLINFYIDEYDASEDYHERSILWPIINWYSSPNRNGFRVFPVFWRKNWNDSLNKYESSQTITLLYYGKSIKNIESGEYKYRQSVSPLYYMSEDNSESESSYSLFVPIIPLFYRGIESDNSKISKTTVSPLFYYNTEDIKNNDKIITGTKFWFPLLPVYYRYKTEGYSHWNLLGLIDSCNSLNYNRFFFLPFYYSSDDDAKKHRNILGIIDWQSNKDISYSFLFFPFFWRDVEPGYRSLIIFPLLSYFNEDRYGKTKFIAGTYWYSSPDYERTNILYLYDHEKHSRNGKGYDQYSFLFTTIEFDFEENYTEMRLLWSLLLKYQSDKKYGSYDIDAFLWFAGIERNGDYFHNRIFPAYWYSRNRNSSFLLLPPLLSLFSNDRSGNFDLGILGILYYRNEDRYSATDRRMLLLGTLYNEVKYPERRYHAWGSFWGVLWDYETEEEGSYKRFTILKGLYKYINNNGKTEHTLFWIF